MANLTVTGSAGNGIDLSGPAPLRFENHVFEDNEAASLRVSALAVPALGTGHQFLSDGDRIEVTNGTKMVTGTWSDHGVPYVVAGDAGADIDAEVTIAPGVEILQQAGSIGSMNSTIRAVGTEDAPIRFASASEAPAAGDWGCVMLGTGSRLDHAVIEHGGSGDGCYVGNSRAAILANGSANITNTTFKDIAGKAIISGISCADSIAGSQWCTENTFENLASMPAVTCSTDSDFCAE
jgi:hypothetical protein